MFYLNIKLIINYNYLCLILNIFRYKYKFLNLKKYNDSLFLIIFLSKAFLGIIKLYLIYTSTICFNVFIIVQSEYLFKHYL